MGFDNEAQRQTWLREILTRIAALVEEDKSMRDEGELESTYAVTTPLSIACCLKA